MPEDRYKPILDYLNISIGDLESKCRYGLKAWNRDIQFIQSIMRYDVENLFRILRNVNELVISLDEDSYYSNKIKEIRDRYKELRISQLSSKSYVDFYNLRDVDVSDYTDEMRESYNDYYKSWLTEARNLQFILIRLHDRSIPSGDYNFNRFNKMSNQIDNLNK